MTLDRVEAYLGAVFEGLPASAAAGLPLKRGRALDIVEGQERLLFVASDRLWAYDRFLATIPFKGEVHTKLSAFWFRQCADLVPNHLLESPGPSTGASSGRLSLVRKAEIIPCKVVVRGYLAGRAWEDYCRGRPVCGINLPAGLRTNEKFPIPILAPHWEGRTPEAIEPELWAEMEKAALALFRRGQELALKAGLILVDSVYQFGLVQGGLCLCGDLHGLETSHYWWSAGYPSLFATADTQRDLDKDVWLRWLSAQGYEGNGAAPSLPDLVRAETGWLHIQAFETITGDFFEPLVTDPQAEAQVIERIVRRELVPG